MTEQERLAATARKEGDWDRWGPYLAERAWGTVREDYSPDGSAWGYFPHDHARSRAYRWTEDGLAGISDRKQRVCLAFALWNEKDPILKERLFGLSGTEGNHAEDVKELYYYVDNSPSHTYMKFLYKYPQAEFPYRELVDVNASRYKQGFEYELVDTGVLDEDRYFDFFVEYAKPLAEDMLLEAYAANRSPETAPLHLLPQIWFRNDWTWFPNTEKPRLTIAKETKEFVCLKAEHPKLGTRYLYVEGAPELLFTENETNFERCFNSPNQSEFVKDAFHARVIGGDEKSVNPAHSGTKAAAWFKFQVEGNGTARVRLRLCDQDPDKLTDPFGIGFEQGFKESKQLVDDFYSEIIPAERDDEEKNVIRQALSGMCWTKQFYHYVVEQWQKGDPAMPDPPPGHAETRNQTWEHLFAEDVLSMPDKWEYPWFAVWDSAFHTVPIALIDPAGAKRELILFLREWYTHPNGQLPAYEWNFSDVNPPVHAWACLRVFEIEKQRTGKGDYQFLERVFHKLSLNFNWWINRKDIDGNNVFQGGFLGMDNVGPLDRSQPVPMGGQIEQADGTAWMATFCLNMLEISLILAHENPAYEDAASKYWEHFLYIANAMNRLAGKKFRSWNEKDGFFYDVIHTPDGSVTPVDVRSMVGLTPLFACCTIEPDDLKKLKGFSQRMHWFMENRPDLTDGVLRKPDENSDDDERYLMSIVDRHKLIRVLQTMLDENEFLSPHGIRSLSKYHERHPFKLKCGGDEHWLKYEPAESESAMFGGNSNWRGPVWFPVNYLLIEALQECHRFYGDSLKVECPTGSGNLMTLQEVATELSLRLARIFLPDGEGKRPVYGGIEKFQFDDNFKDLVLFHEYFNGDNGAGLGASHQTGWTGLVANLLIDRGASCFTR